MNIEEIIDNAEKKCADIFAQINKNALINQKKVLQSFQKNRVALSNFSQSSGYGYEDTGKVKLAEVFATALGAEKAIVSPLIVSGTHALSLVLFGILRPSDLLVSITGEPYDSLQPAVHGKGIGSLADFGVKFKAIDFIDGVLDEDKIVEVVSKNKPKLVYIQRSCGYTSREALSIEVIKNVISKIKSLSPSSIVMVDNCYGTFLDTKEPVEVGADVMVDSLIKNAGGGIAPTGAYIAGKKSVIDMIENRMTAPGLGNEVGSYAASYAPFFEGFFIAPHVVAGALKGSVLAGAVLKEFGFSSSPKPYTFPLDMIRKINFNTESQLVSFIQSIQKCSPVDSFVLPIPSEMPGYADKVIMASGSFNQGSSIELSCDAPVRSPYIAYLQGGLTYEHIKIALEEALKDLK